ncbi:MAG: glycine/D-amino acid oxidase-like deaminating enzyme [Polyangiales bacterium]|jgi:glycine/D-amino acid oxidase-like deaminating enzyme
MTTRRRDVLFGLLGAPLAGQILGCGPSDALPEEVAVEGRLRGPNHELGHRLREDIDPADWDDVPEERVDVAIVGGGVAGLAAGWRLRRQGRPNVRIYEMENTPGGTARGGQSRVSRYPWGAHYLPVPRQDDRILRSLLTEMGALRDGGEPAEEVLVREPDERVFFRGFWYRGLYPYAGASPEDLAELERFQSLMAGYAARRDEDGHPAFRLPMRECSRDPELLRLDTFDAATFLAQSGFRSPRLLWLCDYACRDDYGLRLADASAWALVFYWAARMEPGKEESSDILTWPEGNSALTKHMARSLRGRIDSNVLAARVEVLRDAEGEGARLLLLTPSGARRSVRAERVIMATPQFITRHLVVGAETPRFDGTSFGPWMVANLHLNERPNGRGVGLSWDNVLYDSPSLGYVSATHQRGREVGPTVWTYYFPLCDGTPSEARQRLFDANLEEWQEAIILDLERAHPSLRQHLRKVDIWRWGHGMVQPRVGFLGGGARFDAGAPSGPIHFAHSDLSGLALFEEAFHHGVRAADEVIARGRG